MKNNSKQKFLWGVVNIGQQTEGSNKNSNWDSWARRGQVPCIGCANNYWGTYKKYHNLVDEIGCNSLRITIEWSRIEPVEGQFDIKAIQQYKNILKDLRKRRVTTVVGLWHWSVPMWFEQKYGMHNSQAVKLFLRFVAHVRDELGDLIDYVVVLNEPSVYVGTSYVHGIRPPFYKNYFRALKTAYNLLCIHKKTYILWKKKFPRTQVGSTFLCNDESGRDNSVVQKMYIFVKRFLQNEYMIHAVCNTSDYIGINYYTSNQFYFGKSGGRLGWHGTNDWHSPDVWKTFARGLYRVLIHVKKYHKPIIILENGKPTNLGIDDKDRQELLQEMISYMQKAINEGVDIIGYFHYSLCDSYEWDSGYNFKFGLVEINRKTGKLIKRKSFFLYKEIIKNNT